MALWVLRIARGWCIPKVHNQGQLQQVAHSNSPVAPSGPSMAPVVTPNASAAPTPYSAKRCSDAQTRSIVMGADAYFNDSSAWMHYYPADTCVGEEDDTVYRCSDDGYVLYRYLFAEAGCSGSASVQVLNVTAGAAEVGSNFFVDCSCSSESNHYIEARAFADSNCTSECGSESASCNSSVATFLSGTVVQMVVSGNSYNDDDSMDWTYGGNSSYGGYGWWWLRTATGATEAMAMETVATGLR